MKRALPIAAVLSVALLLQPLTAEAVGKPADQIRWRQSVFQVFAWNMGRIKANLEGTYNKDDVAQAAANLAALANGGLGSLFAPGTEQGKGWKNTEAKPELFKDKEGVGKAAKALSIATTELAKAAAAGDQIGVDEQFGKVGQACKGCHDKYRVEN